MTEPQPQKPDGKEVTRMDPSIECRNPLLPQPDLPIDWQSSCDRLVRALVQHGLEVDQGQCRAITREIIESSFEMLSELGYTEEEVRCDRVLRFSVEMLASVLAHAAPSAYRVVRNAMREMIEDVIRWNKE